MADAVVIAFGPTDEAPLATIRAERPALLVVDVQCPHCTSHRPFHLEVLFDSRGCHVPCWACRRLLTLPHPPTTEGAA